MANTYQNWQVFTNEALRILKNELVFLKGVSRDNQYLFAKPGMKSGNTINVRLPARFVGRVGEAYQPESFVQTSVPVVVRPMQGLDIDIPSTEWTLNIEDVKRDILRPAMAQLVNNIERDCLQIAYQGIANHVGTPGTAPNTSGTPLSARALLANLAAPTDDLRMIITPNTQVALVPAFQGLFNPQMRISQQWEKGLMGKNTLGWDWYESQNLWTHTVGAQGGTPLVNLSNQAGSTLNTKGWSNSTAILKKGDIFTIGATAGTKVYAVNPMTRISFGSQAQFVVTADVSSDGSGNATIPIQCHDGRGITPAPQQFANVDSLPVNNSSIDLFGTGGVLSGQCLGYHRDAFTFAGISQEVPKGSTEMAYEATDPDTGVQLRFVRQFVATQNLFVNRFDILYAFAVTYPQLAVRVSSN